MTRNVTGMCVAVVLAIGGQVALAGDGDSSVYVVHGIPGQDVSPKLDPSLPVDVFIDSDATGPLCALEGFSFGEIVGPLDLPAGEYDILISLANEMDPCGSDPVIEAYGVPLMVGVDYSIVAYLTESGMPTAGLFENDLSATGRGKARLIAQHTAAAPVVDVDIRRDVDPGSPGLTIQDFANGDQAAAEVRPGGWLVSIAPAGMSDPVFGPIEIELKPFTAYLIYAVGSVDSGSFTLLVEAVGGLK